MHRLEDRINTEKSLTDTLTVGRGMLCAVALTGALFANYVGSEPNVPPPNTPSIGKDLPLPAGPMMVDPAIGEAGPCRRDTAASEEKQAAGAKACKAAYTGKIALVNFGASDRNAAAVARGIGTMLKGASKDVLQPSVTAIPASKDAKRKLIELTGPKKCTEGEKSASAAADQTMPELDNYDFVVAISSLAACSFAVSGFAYGGRQAEISGRTGKPALDDVSGMTLIGVHEIGHLYMLGHVGYIYKGRGEGDLSAAKIPAGPASFDLYQYLNGYQYHEYEPHGVDPMGGWEVTAKNAAFHPLLLETLRWPKVALGDKSASRNYRLGNEPITLDGTAARETAFISAKLPSALVLNPLEDGKPDKKTTRTFTTVNLVPIASANKTSMGVRGAEVILSVEDSSQLAKLGIIALPKGVSTGAWQFKLDTKLLSVQIDGGALKAQLLPAA